MTVHSIKAAAADFESGLILTLYGTYCGRDPAGRRTTRGLSDDQRALAAQLPRHPTR
jgi:hypothetical protein